MLKGQYKNLVILVLMVLLAVVVVSRIGGECGEECITESKALFQSLTDISANDSDTDWVITKYYYGENGTLTEMRVRETSWTNRSIGW